jgi:hypothetical protein
MNVKLIRIVTGEEIVAEVVSETDDTITVKNGLVVLPTGQSIGFAPWATVISKDDPEITMDRKHVIYVAEVQDSVSEKYQDMFSVIKAPSKKLVL